MRSSDLLELCCSDTDAEEAEIRTDVPKQEVLLWNSAYLQMFWGDFLHEKLTKSPNLKHHNCFTFWSHISAVFLSNCPWSPSDCSCRTSVPVPELWPMLRPRHFSRLVTATVTARSELMVRRQTGQSQRRKKNFFFFLVNVKNLIKTVNADWKMSPVSPLQSLPSWLSNKWLSWPTSYFTTPTFTTTRGTTWAMTCFSSFCLSLTSLQVSSQLLYRKAHRPDPNPLRLWPLLSVMNVPDWN